MTTMHRVTRLLGVSAAAFFCGHLSSAQTLRPSHLVATTTHPPAAYGTHDYTITMVPAVSFFPPNVGDLYFTSGSLGRNGTNNLEQHFYAGLDLPAGVLIDYIGFNNLNDGEANVIAIHLWLRDGAGALHDLFDLDNTPHTSWATDINAVAVGILWLGSELTSNVLILDMEVAPNPNIQYFGSVEVWWKRMVSPAPATADFNDVPTTHPFFQFIEALKASGITGGCQASPPLYCPDNPVTRGQMAVFLAKALGLHWPN